MKRRPTPDPPDPRERMHELTEILTEKSAAGEDVSNNPLLAELEQHSPVMADRLRRGLSPYSDPFCPGETTADHVIRLMEERLDPHPHLEHLIEKAEADLDAAKEGNPDNC